MLKPIVEDFNTTAPFRLSALKGEFEKAAASACMVPITAFGVYAATGEGLTVTIAYFFAKSLDEARAEVVSRFGQFFADNCEIVGGFVTQANLQKDPQSKLWQGIADVWPFYESMVAPYLIDNINKGGHSNLDLTLKFHTNYA